MIRFRKLIAASALSSVVLFGAAACGSDEDGDGAKTDEEINQVDEGVEDGVDQGKEEVKEGADEVDDGEETTSTTAG